MASQARFFLCPTLVTQTFYLHHFITELKIYYLSLFIKFCFCFSFLGAGSPGKHDSAAAGRKRLLQTRMRTAQKHEGKERLDVASNKRAGNELYFSFLKANAYSFELFVESMLSDPLGLLAGVSFPSVKGRCCLTNRFPPFP